MVETPTQRISARVLGMAGGVLLALFFLAGVIYSSMLPATGRFPDEFEYLTLTRNLLHGPGFSMDGVHLTAMLAPGFPFFLAILGALGAGVGLMRVGQYALLAGTMVLVWRMAAARRTGGVVVVVGLVALYPVLFYTASTLYPQTLAGFLFMAALAQLLAQPRSGWLDVTTGLTFGALILDVPTFLFTFAVALITAAGLRLVRGRGVVAMVIAAGLVVGTWTARNAVEFHQFVPVASNSGNNFLLGNNENTTPWGGSDNIDRTHYQTEAKRLGLDEFQTDHYYRRAAWSWIEEHPGRAGVLYLEKALNFFNVWNQYSPGNATEISPWKQGVMAVSYVLLLGLLAWRLLEARRFPLEVWEKFFLILYVASAFTMAIFFTRIRHRLPYDYLVIGVIAGHLSRRLQGWLERGAE